MPGTVQGGALGRWFEELCRIAHHALAELTSGSGTRMIPRVLPDKGGVYAFWWTGDRALLSSPDCKRRIALAGPGGSTVTLEIDDEWLGLATGLPVPLYVGKSAASIRRRVGQHLMLSRERILPIRRGIRKAKAPTTTCQLRAGIEHWFPDRTDRRSLLLQNVGLSYVLLDGPQERRQPVLPGGPGHRPDAPALERGHRALRSVRGVTGQADRRGAGDTRTCARGAPHGQLIALDSAPAGRTYVGIG